MTNTEKLTEPQKRYLAEIRATLPGSRTYNGRARRPLEALRDAGLITIDFDLRPHTGAWSEMWTCTAITNGTYYQEGSFMPPKDDGDRCVICLKPVVSQPGDKGRRFYCEECE